MGELKPGWKRVKFAQLAECVNDRVDDPSKSGVDRYVGLDHLDPESLTIRRWGAPDEVESTKLRFKPGDIIFGKRRAYQRKLAVADFDGICSAHAMVLRAKPATVLPEFLPYFMRSDSFMERAVAISVGSLSPTINWKTLAAEEFALPPLEEQRSVCTVLGAVQRVVEAGSNALLAANDLERALLAATFPLERYTPHAETAPLHAVAEVKLGYKVTPAHRGPRVTKPVVTVAQLQDGWFDLASVKEVTIPFHMVDGYRPAIGALLITEGGNIDQLGRGAIWKGEMEDCIYQNHVFSIAPHMGLVRSEYLEGLMRSPRGREFFLRHAKRTSNLASIDQRKVRTLPVPLMPIKMQDGWVEQYKSVVSNRSLVSSRLAAHRALAHTAAASLLGGH